ncbi:hypothetical protein SISNIDRAFT_460208 [Sistotremastrum niveocremeum HHB9708]|uniref:Uncharacterized protein n=1 Tax=Sistotremastrum niveocremeum HHB9708 TaxID=1314777 RepID=A0A164NXD4_9AGAM|nr:hypothetical protein SISNIDRAFT_460208 [Sistotremastrum niveocremeum HHB9708]
MASSSPSRPFAHTVKQLKFVLPGSVTVWLFRPLTHIWLLLDEDGWTRLSAGLSLATGVLTLILFVYLMLLPWFRGYQPNYRQWRDSGELSLVVPVLTGSIVFGYFLLVFTLSQFSELGITKSLVASTGLYILSFGLVGLFPVPNRRLE